MDDRTSAQIREEILVAARACIDTIWYHRGRTPGVGIDCAGVLVYAGRTARLVAPTFDVPAYTKTPDGNLLSWCDRYLGARVDYKDMRPADVVVVRTDNDPQHLGIVDTHQHRGLAVIHASNAPSIVPNRVIKTRLMFMRGFRFVAAYKFPGVED